MAGEINQNVDAIASVDTKTRSSATRTGSESCSESRTYKKCDMSTGEPVYKDLTARISGSRLYKYHVNTTIKGIHFELLSPGTEEVLAQFVGDDVTSSTVREFTGRCQLDRISQRDFRRLRREAVICKKPRDTVTIVRVQ